MYVSIVLLAFALACFCIAAFFWPEPQRVRLGWLGLAFWIAAELLGKAHF